MAGSRRWLLPNQAAKLIQRTHGGSIGAAVPILRNAMVSGEVRVCSLVDGARHAGHLWTSADFDLERNIITADDQWSLDHGLAHRRQYNDLKISADDLRDWLLRKPADQPPPPKPSSQPAAQNRPPTRAARQATASLAAVKRALRKHGPGSEAALTAAARDACRGRHIPRSLVRQARDELWGAPDRGRPKKTRKSPR
jgi:hypothetical protein